ncbi:Cd(II)/Pb(II)-responsive transcriptional regulator [Wohlfahrtiimonas sp. G9077]|uniref:Cd(II)/Pb(II)-responsive transcriptional regulator n=1 Tax=Wohlfahrtiimonas sp. G9077 TaxID=1980118 RepID=UPI000B98D40D|nr:Cd(II)/Pb(II)-responsive transcriptional regulator [Wohlfahrtiimonas sp. G9077]OYQ74313.1 Cd(II)/Pb(II)-responsive transcriptional regulator [Wohlfahrtiimonas sp. G9077]
MKIGQLSELTGVSTETIRYYEKQKLLPMPARLANNYRSYDQSHVERLTFIKNCRAFDMTHEEIHQLLDEVNSPSTKDCSPINYIIQQHVLHLEARIEELMDLKARLTAIEQRCRRVHAADRCTIIEDIAKLEAIVPRTTHLNSTMHKKKEPKLLKVLD